MAFDGFVTKSIVLELNNTLIGGKINKIYEPNKNEILLEIYHKEKHLLAICIESSNCRIHLTKHQKENPKIAPNFCMVLRKYLNGASILSVDSYQLDRIVTIRLENYNELNDLVEYQLIVELMGKHSNLILLNHQNKMIDSLRHIHSEQALRNILPGHFYTFPSSDKLNLLEITQEVFISKILAEEKNDLITILQKLFTGISKPLASFVLEKLTINKDQYQATDLSNLYCYLKELIQAISENRTKCENFEWNGKKEFCITPCINKTASTSTNSFVDTFYFNKETVEMLMNYRNSVLKLILSLLNKYNKKLITIQEKLDECKNMEQYQLYGELITSNLYRIDQHINLENITLENYYDHNQPITIPLDPKIPPSYNAKKYFKKYHKLKNTFQVVNIQKKQIQNEINYLESIVYALENSHSIEEVHQIHQEIEENILKVSTPKTSSTQKVNTELTQLKLEGFDVYIGKNNTQNDMITFKLSDKNDLWFHVQGFHGSHVLLKTNGKEIPDDHPVILKCAKLAATHSKANQENKVLVDYTLVKNLKKPKGAKPGYVVFNQHKTIIVSL